MKFYLALMFMFSFLWMGCNSAPQNSNELSPDEDKAFAKFARAVMDDGLSRGLITIVPEKYVVKTKDCVYFLDYVRTNRNGKVTYERRDDKLYEVAEKDMDVIRTQLPVFANLRWANKENHNGDVSYEWYGATGAVYGIEFSGPLNDPSRCFVRMIAVRRIPEKMLQQVMRYEAADKKGLIPKNEKPRYRAAEFGNGGPQ